VSGLTIQPNTHVTLDYELRDDDGDLLDASETEGGEPIRYVHGYGMLVPGLEKALVGLAVGEQREIVVPAEAGYGAWDEELVLEIEKSELPDAQTVEVGDEVVATMPDGEEVAMEVVEVKPGAVVVDANHPLAGMTLHYKVIIREVREASEGEVEEAAAEFERAREEAEGEKGEEGVDRDLVPLRRNRDESLN
jgi:FKBP-type peptidyl-prolyl cis-trans isomerase SlyD